MGLNRFNLVVIGAGALGCAVLEKLVDINFASVRVVDGDIVTMGNLKNQRLYSKEDAFDSRYKATAAVARLKGKNDITVFTAFPFYMGEKRVNDILDGADLVLDLTDNLETRLTINDACAKNGIPLLVASLRTKDGFFYLIDWSNACFNCIQRNSSSKGEEGCVNIQAASAAFIGELMVNEVLSFFEGKAEFFFNSISFEPEKVSRITIKKDPNCEVCGKHKYTHHLENEFIQMCGEGIKFSMQQDLDIKKLEKLLPGAIKKNDGQAIMFKNLDKAVFISNSGDFLFNGYTLDEAKKLIARVSHVVV